MGGRKAANPGRPEPLLLEARDFDALQTALRGLDIQIPDNPRDYTNRLLETYTLAKVLRAIPAELGWFPMKVIHRDRPDVLIEAGHCRIGVEHTEGTTPNLSKSRALRADGFGADIHFVEQASIHDPVKSRAALLAEIEADDPGDGWVGDSVERNWAEAMAVFIARKTASALKPGYERYDRNWLMIYDNFTSPGLKHRSAVPYLRTHLGNAPPWPAFDRVFIADESVVIELAFDSTLFHAGF